MKFKQLIVVYGTLTRGHDNNRLLQNPHSKYLGEVETEPNYTMFGGGFPIVERNGDTSIKGEVWKVTDETVMNRIHQLEGCTGIKGHPSNWYDIDDVETPFGKASMYVMDKSGRDKSLILKSGKWN